MVVDRSEELPGEPLLLAVARGEPDAVQRLIDRYGNLVWSLARRFDPDDAEDAVQEIFMHLWTNANRFDPAIASEPTFIAMIARRRLIDRRRTRQHHRTASDAEIAVPDTTVAEGSPLVATEAALVANALEELRPEQREVFLLATCFGLTHVEIAQRTGLPLGTVKAHARRGLFAARHAVFGKKGPP